MNIILQKRNIVKPVLTITRINKLNLHIYDLNYLDKLD